MSTAPAFIVHDGKLDNTEDLHQSLGLNEGEKLFVVSSNGHEIVLRREEPTYMGMTITEYMAGWDRLDGILKDGIDTAEERAAETAWELEHDRRKFGE